MIKGLLVLGAGGALVLTGCSSTHMNGSSAAPSPSSTSSIVTPSSTPAGGAVTITLAGTSLPHRLAVATYLLSEGHFFDVLRTDAAVAGAVVSDPLGAHPAIADLILRRYDEARAMN